ncbi:MAG: DUF1275 family protein [Oscillospiraceae bacterium]|nr:DUF1275 family protein [Oscillospiraceae bacterium]
MENAKTGLNTKIHIVGFILMAIAGWIDTIALYVCLSENSSFLTGRVAKLGHFIINSEKANAIEVTTIIVFFIVGACISALLTQKAGLSFGLYFSAGLIVLTLIWFYTTQASTIAYITLPMSMGGQNAATSLTSINRTTHLTGPITDIGTSLAKGNFKQALFWILRVLGFLAGAAAACYFTSKEVGLFYLLIAPAVVICAIAFFQKRFLIIPVIAD